MEISKHVSYRKHPTFSLEKTIKEKVLSHFLRSTGILEYFYSLHTPLKRSYRDSDYERVARKAKCDVETVMRIIRHFIDHLEPFRSFLEKVKIEWPLEKTRHVRKLRIYLHKMHKIAPVFDYHRARVNLEILETYLRNQCIYISPLAKIGLVILKTDSHLYKGEILIKNIRALCNLIPRTFDVARRKIEN